MLPLSSRIGFLVFAAVMLAAGARGFYRAHRRIRRGRPDSDLRWDHWPSRLWYAVRTTLTQQRTFKKRGVVSLFHSFIFYGFVFYLLVNLVDAVRGYMPLHFPDGTFPPFTLRLLKSYEFAADVLSFLVLVGVLALVVRRFLLPARRDFNFNAKTLLHPKVRRGYVTRDSLIVSAFILLHVGSRAIGAGASLAATPRPDSFQPAGWDPVLPLSSLLACLFTPGNAHAWQVFGYWGALGSVLAFLAYFPYTKHVHIFAAPLKYFLARRADSGILPLVEINLESEEQELGAEKLEDLAWPRLLDAYACIQCNRCQAVCPATATGKALSPAALEINKRMELNDLAHAAGASFESGAPSPHPLLTFALTPEAAWACTTCGACMEACPVQDEQMLDIVDIRRHQVMIAGDFPAQLQTAFRGMERAKNPWGISHEKRMSWAEGLRVPTTDEKPTPDVLYWVGCAASYDPQAQKTARAVVQLLDHAGIDFAVLGKKECCTGDSARRAGNEMLYRQLADENVSTLNAVKPKLVIASCPHCMNALGGEYKQIGGDYTVMHHTQYLATLVDNGRLAAEPSQQSITYHDPCYLGRHNGVYDAPRNLLRVLGSEVLELERTRSNAFCCGAGGAQFWKEEEPGDERISENRFREVQRVLGSASSPQKTLAVGCPFCKSMLGSTPSNDEVAGIAIKDVAELLLEGVHRARGLVAEMPVPATLAEATAPEATLEGITLPALHSSSSAPEQEDTTPADVSSRRLGHAPAAPDANDKSAGAEPDAGAPAAETGAEPARKKWQPKTPSFRSASAAQKSVADAVPPPVSNQEQNPAEVVRSNEPLVERKKWQPKSPAAKSTGPDIARPEDASTSAPAEVTPVTPEPPADSPPVERKKWQPKSKS